MYSIQDLIFSMSLAAYVATSVVVAAVRFGHKCEPYARHMDHYFPAWKTLVFCFLSNLLLLPVAFLPADADAILQLRMMLILASPFCCSAILFSYFGKVLRITWWRKPIIFLAVSITLMVLTALVFTLMPGRQLDGFFMRVFFAGAGLLSLVCFLCFLMAMRMLGQAIRRTSEENYSNPEDFPRQYAKEVIWIPILHIAVSWSIGYVGSVPALSVGMLILSALSVVLLIGALSPHRALENEQLETGNMPATQASLPDASAETEDEILSPERQDEIERAIRAFVEGEQAYLDSHLTLGTLSHGIGVNRTYVSNVLSERLGGFFAYVNRCRLNCADRLKEEQPDRPIAEIIAASGFGSRQTYYNVRRQLEG